LLSPRNTGFDEVAHPPLRRAIVLHPQRAVDDVNMDEAIVDPFVVVPPYCHEHILGLGSQKIISDMLWSIGSVQRVPRDNTGTTMVLAAF
jgi:hypothetical protein